MERLLIALVSDVKLANGGKCVDSVDPELAALMLSRIRGYLVQEHGVILKALEEQQENMAFECLADQPGGSCGSRKSVYQMTNLELAS